MNCVGHILPSHALVPWEVALGVAARFGATPWNRAPPGRFIDERAWTFALDLIVTGETPGGAGVEAFAQDQLQPSGRAIVGSLRAGVEWELTPGVLRMRGGTYLQRVGKF